VIQVFRRAAGYQPSEPAQDVEQCGVMSTRRANALTLALFTFFVFFTGLPSASAQEPSPPNERFVPADQLDAVFERDRRGVMMKRSEFKTLLEQARANGSAEKFPVPIITEHARLTVIPGDHQASVTMNLKVRQYAEGWQVLRIRAGNLLVEKAEIEGQSALIARDPEDPTALLLATIRPVNSQLSSRCPPSWRRWAVIVRRRFSCRTYLPCSCPSIAPQAAIFW
jgi:hypothetical protein